MSQTKSQLIGNVSGGAVFSGIVTATSAQVGSINNGPLAGFRNRIINGDMRIAQRGTSFAAIVSGSYSLDRWLWGQVGAMACTVSQSTDVPNNTFQSSLKVDVTTADTSIAAGDYSHIRQSIEGYNVRDLIGNTFTLSFWVKSPKAGVHCISFANLGPASISDRSYIKEYTISAANTWEYKAVSVDEGLITAGTWDWTNGKGLEVSFVLAAGTTFQTTADAWQTGNFLATANQVNVMDNTANDFFLTGVQLEPGAVATPFERRPIGTELSLCQRYFCKSYEIDVTPGSVSVNLGNPNSLSATNLDWIVCNVSFPVTMRTTPSVSIYRPSTGAISTVEDTGEANPRTVSGIEAGANGIGLLTIASNSPAAATAYQFQYTASAEL